MPRPRLALFDLDNTLVDRQAAHRRWAASFAGQQGLGPGEVEWLCRADADGFARREDVFGQARQRWGISDPVEDLVARYRKSYPTFFLPDAEVNGAMDRLRQAGVPVAVVTNGPPSQREKLDRAGLTSLVQACCISDEIGAAKPDCRIFEEALLRCGLVGGSPEEIVMVGDAPVADVGGGRAMGFRTIWMHRGRRWDVEEFRPDVMVATVPEAVEVILGT